MSDKFNDLHDVLTDLLLEKIKNKTATAADLAVARQFLKDNNIDATRTAKPKMGELAKQVLPEFTNDPDDLMLQ